MIMSERDSVHKEIEKLQEEVSLIINVGLTLTKTLISLKQILFQIRQWHLYDLNITT